MINHLQNGTPELVVMLTYNDLTVENAEEVFEQCRNSQARCWGFKEHPLSFERMKSLCSRMKACGKTTFLEVVAYTEAEGLSGAKVVVDCGFDVLMGTKFHDSINDFCKNHGIKYMPFVGEVTGRPSVLGGSEEEMIKEAEKCVGKGVYGIDLLGYRYTGNALALNRAIVSNLEVPVCLAGSIDSFGRLDEVKDASPCYFTIGSAFFDNKFGGSIGEQIDKVCSYMGSVEI